jgi:hypothetical protein
MNRTNRFGVCAEHDPIPSGIFHLVNPGHKSSGRSPIDRQRASAQTSRQHPITLRISEAAVGHRLATLLEP